MEVNMKNLSLTTRAIVMGLFAALFIWGCDKDDSTAATQTVNDSTVQTPAKVDKRQKAPQTYQRVKKTYNGQTIYLLDIDDFPLRGVPLATIREDANAGDPAAQYELGRRLGAGEGVPRDIHEGLQWIKKAAKNNDPDAQFDLGMMYSLGAGVRQSPDQAVYWFQKAAEQGHVLAQDDLAQMYTLGTEIPRDYTKALYWAQKAAEQGFGPSQNRMGMIYRQGRGVHQEKTKALE